jgi:gas vesicle protein
MNRSTIAALGAPLVLLAACNMTDNQNGSTTISLDENKIEQGTDMLANQAEKVGDKAANVVENAGPELEQSASEIKERAGRVADKVDNKVDNVDVDVELNTADDKPAPKAN